MKKIVLLALLICSHDCLAQALFEGSYKRTVASLDVVRFLFAKFRIDPTEEGYISCRELEGSEHIVLGTLLPAEGRRLIDKPEPEFVRWYLSCAEELARRQFYLYYQIDSVDSYNAMMDKSREFVGEALWEEWLTQERPSATTFGDGSHLGDAVRVVYLGSYGWLELPDEVRRAALAHLISFLVGPDFMLEELGLIGPHSVLEARPETPADLRELIYAQLEPSEDTTLSDAIVFYSVLILSIGELLVY